MRPPRFYVLGAAAVGALGLALAPGCRDATQVTVEINLAKRAICTETNGTAITVGTEPLSTEKRVTEEYVTATTSTCSDATHQIGTLVVTPGGADHASIIVVVAYDKSILPSSCKPPLYKGCIVARRRFTFSEYKQLRLPITIDPDCKDVPCDAFSTCRTGKCFTSDAPSDGDVIVEPGDPGDGGTSADGEVIPDTGVDSPLPQGDGSTDGAVDAQADGPDPSDGGVDASTSDASTGPSGVYCDDTGDLMCPPPTVCNTGSSCCGAQGGPASCVPAAMSCPGGAVQYCCAKALCPVGKMCLQAALGGQNAQLPIGATKAGTCN